MERIQPNIDEILKSEKEIQIKTENIQAGFLKNGDIILWNDVECDVVDVDHQKENSFIKVKDRNGNEQQVYAYNHVERLILE